MGLKEIIEFLRTKFFVEHLLCNARPHYQSHESRTAAILALRQLKVKDDPDDSDSDHEDETESKSIHEAPHEYVTAERDEKLTIHLDPSSKIIKIEDWMLALRRPRKIVKESGYKNSGKHFYEDLIRPVIEYGSNPNVAYIILVVDKGSPPEKKETQEKRAKTQERSKELRKKREELLDRASEEEKEKKGIYLNPKKRKDTVQHVDEEELPNDIEITDDGICIPETSFGKEEENEENEHDAEYTKTNETRKEKNKTARHAHTMGKTRKSTKTSDGHDEKQEQEPEVLLREINPQDWDIDDPRAQESAELHRKHKVYSKAPDQGSGKKKNINLDAARIMNNRPLRIKLYRYLLRCMTNDTNLFRMEGNRKVPLRIIFDFEPASGPWLICDGKATLCRDKRNDIMEADLACFWWATHSPTYDIFIHAGDTDYIAIALLNAARFERSLVVQIRSHKDPVCMEAHHVKHLLQSHGCGMEEFVLGCIMNGTDFVDRSLYLNGLGMHFVWRGILLYRKLRNLLLREFARTTDERTTRIAVLDCFRRTLLGSGEAWDFSSLLPCSSQEWVGYVCFEEFPEGLDAVVTCIYLQYYHDIDTRHKVLVSHINDASFPFNKTLKREEMNQLWTNYVRPVLAAAKNELASKTKSKSKTPRPPKGIPDFSNPTYQNLVLKRIRFTLDYWSSLQNSVDILI